MSRRLPPASPAAEPLPPLSLLEVHAYQLEPVLRSRIEELDLSVRTAHHLENAGIEFVHQIAEETEAAILKDKGKYFGLGAHSLNEIREQLKEKGVILGRRFTGALKEHLGMPPTDDEPCEEDARLGHIVRVREIVTENFVAAWTAFEMVADSYPDPNAVHKKFSELEALLTCAT